MDGTEITARQSAAAGVMRRQAPLFNAFHDALEEWRSAARLLGTQTDKTDQLAHELTVDDLFRRMATTPAQDLSQVACKLSVLDEMLVEWRLDGERHDAGEFVLLGAIKADVMALTCAARL